MALTVKQKAVLRIVIAFISMYFNFKFFFNQRPALPSNLKNSFLLALGLGSLLGYLSANRNLSVK